jgi:hypothetical protein
LEANLEFGSPACNAIVEFAKTLATEAGLNKVQRNANANKHYSKKNFFSH